MSFPNKPGFNNPTRIQFHQGSTTKQIAAGWKQQPELPEKESSSLTSYTLED